MTIDQQRGSAPADNSDEQQWRKRKQRRRHRAGAVEDGGPRARAE
jgi:hypothetical protein